MAHGAGVPMRYGLGLTLLLLAGSAGAASPFSAGEFAYHPRPGARVPVQLTFRDSDGALRVLESTTQGVPLILVPAYFNCPNLCPVVRASLFGALRSTELRAGRDYTVAVLSIDPRESTDDAKSAKARDVAAFDLPGASEHWHYLTGAAENIRAVLDVVGFRDRPDPRSRQFLHPAGVVVLTAKGVVSSYLLGVGYTPAQVRAAVERAAAGDLAAVGSPLLLLCFHFDETTGRYSLEVMRLVRLAAIITVLTLAGVVYLLVRRRPPHRAPRRPESTAL